LKGVEGFLNLIDETDPTLDREAIALASRDFAQDAPARRPGANCTDTQRPDSSESRPVARLC